MVNGSKSAMDSRCLCSRVKSLSRCSDSSMILRFSSSEYCSCLSFCSRPALLSKRCRYYPSFILDVILDIQERLLLSETQVKDCPRSLSNLALGRARRCYKVSGPRRYKTIIQSLKDLHRLCHPQMCTSLLKPTVPSIRLVDPINEEAEQFKTRGV